jgi:hypothetical protein
LIPRACDRVNGPGKDAALANSQKMSGAMRHLAKLSIPLVGITAALAWPNVAAAEEPDRNGGQVDILVGGSGCIQARGDCRFNGEGETFTKGSAGLAFDVGWRANRAFFLGASYSVGWFTPTWELGDEAGRDYRTAYNQGVFAVLRAYIPIWRIDIGLEVSPGWSQTTFVAENSDIRNLSHGFALRPGMSVDFRLGEHLFLGARLDFLLNFHTRFCAKDGMRDCGNQPTIPQVPVHQVIGGIHFGATF